MNDSHSQMLHAKAKREEMMRTAENERLAQSIQTPFWQRVRRWMAAGESEKGQVEREKIFHRRVSPGRAKSAKVVKVR
jgi:hypothetical protein